MSEADAAPEAPASANMVSGSGRIEHIELEGGFYVLLADNGKRYDPIRLPAEFQHAGLRVRFEGRVRSDVVTFHMWGTPLEILKIEKADTK